jgi:O-acetyl-ADP-ribose deacetylase (regulator of RNase III)
VWEGGGHGEAELLASCYRRSLEVAVAHEVKTIAFPSISTGVYGYPVEQAARIAVETVSAFLREHPALDVTFCCFSPADLDAYRKAIAEVAHEHA